MLVGFLHSASPQQYGGVLDAFRKGLKETGFVEAQNLAIEQRWAEDQNDRLPTLAADLIRRPVAAIAANSVAALSAKAATTTIPIVFQSGVDPVGLGLVSSLGHPGRNATGVSYFASTMEAKKLEVMHELISPERAIALLANANSPQVERQLQEVEAAGRTLAATGSGPPGWQPSCFRTRVLHYGGSRGRSTCRRGRSFPQQPPQGADRPGCAP